ncbi:hypothetical protein GCM10007338_16220 [Corynebacterium pelargi]|uniref:Uncharacterized protein n=1 Tax=Corynebacterium pelargi TaxID=1471400 RepID=A0A410WA11_9CORY|nr:hypothetical protein CPELA_07655 [Corynebacterium pelargi]GGG78800.1 hypothetical protein GCM10007338_16220 [Corynebacterium pelargi]
MQVRRCGLEAFGGMRPRWAKDDLRDTAFASAELCRGTFFYTGYAPFPYGSVYSARSPPGATGSYWRLLETIRRVHHCNHSNC